VLEASWRVITMRKIAIGRVIGLLLALLGTGLSVWFACDAVRSNAEFYEWLDARPMETAIDLSIPGETKIPFHQTCSIAHGEALYIDVDSNEVPPKRLEELFKGLLGKIIIEDSAGNEIVTAGINSKSVQHWGGQIMLTGIAPFENGDYIATIRVESGAANLAHKQQTLYAEYQLCGLEKMPAMIAGAIAFGSGLIGLVCTLCVLPGLLQSGFRRNTRTETA
jgi:hypothetical protein